ncbi:MAG TPA: hypothetical protein VL693_15850 [Vicinamibacterales bacterium]|jgi:hypothetical protein|nr:hypothetical protein [Vicinamibacterales bacterium]
MPGRLRTGRIAVPSGATALEIFGVEADPTTQQLKPIAAIIGGFLGSSLHRTQKS